MSKTIALSLVLAASLGLAACSKEAENTANAANNTAEMANNTAENAMNVAENATNAMSNMATNNTANAM